MATHILSHHSTTEISESWELWCEYVDTNATMTEEEFNAMTIQEKNLIQRECFPDECDDIDDEGNEITED